MQKELYSKAVISVKFTKYKKNIYFFFIVNFRIDFLQALLICLESAPKT